MAFSSVIFLFYFLPVILAGYYLLPKLWLKNLFLFLVSLLFYFWGAGNLVVLLPVVGFAAWGFSFLIAKTKFKGLFLFITMLSFVGILIYFKYLGFIIDNLIYAGISGLTPIKSLNFLGVSFFTFQAISYNIDVYRKNNRFEKNPAAVMLYITMFPQLISGPLVRYHQIEQQLKQRSFNFARFSEGVRRFIIGLGKKVLIANSLSYMVKQIVDDDVSMISPLVAWVGMIIFAVQIFFDFSGYTDMAIGVGKMLGFELPENFNYPYISRSITEFWRRWHITLSKWIKDYIFSPLAMELRYWGNTGIFISLVVTFIICGMWHGPTWNFIMWGTIQGVFLGFEELFLLKYLKRLRGFAVLYVMFIILSCMVFFRTPDMSHAFNYFAVMFSPAKEGALGLNAFFSTELSMILFFGILFCIPLKLPERFRIGRKGSVINVINSALLIVVFMLSIMRLVSETYNPFIYFKF